MPRRQNLRGQVRQALAGGGLSLHALWRKTGINKETLLGTLNNMTRDKEIVALDRAPQAGRSTIADHDDRRWELRTSAATQEAT